jgi:hypothetical protein
MDPNITMNTVRREGESIIGCRLVLEIGLEAREPEGQSGEF